MRQLQILISMALVALSSLAGAQTYERAQTWEAGFLLVDTGSDFVSGQNGSSVDVEGEVGWGFWGAYNFNNRFAVQFDWSHLSPDYTATYRLEDMSFESLRHTADIDNLHLKGTFYFFEGDITPFVEAGLGWTWIDSNVASGPPTTGCWWDPWWGYICQSYYNTYDSTNTSYTYSAGIRWDISPGLLVRAEYGYTSIDASAASGSVDLPVFRMAIGWRF